jgi:hypothetical protein
MMGDPTTDTAIAVVKAVLAEDYLEVTAYADKIVVRNPHMNISKEFPRYFSWRSLFFNDPTRLIEDGESIKLYRVRMPNTTGGDEHAEAAREEGTGA